MQCVHMMLSTAKDNIQKWEYSKCLLYYFSTLWCDHSLQPSRRDGSYDGHTTDFGWFISFCENGFVHCSEEKSKRKFNIQENCEILEVLLCIKRLWNDLYHGVQNDLSGEVEYFIAK